MVQLNTLNSDSIDRVDRPSGIHDEYPGGPRLLFWLVCLFFFFFHFISIVKITIQFINVTKFRGLSTKISLERKCSVGEKLRKKVYGPKKLYLGNFYNVHEIN